MILLSSRVAQEIFKLRIEAYTVNAGLNMALKYCFSFATDVFANFSFYQFKNIPDIVLDNVSKLLHIPLS